jgi:histidine ammonia-lyase
MPATITLAPEPIDLQDVVAVARHRARVKLAPKALAAMARSRAVVDRSLRSGKPFYGINTGFGSLAQKRIGDDDLLALQRNLVRSHAAGFSDPLPVDVTRAMMTLLAASLARGLSGVRPVVAQTLCDLLNAGLTPVVPSVGSVGASGDLAPLAAVALALIGEGRMHAGVRSVEAGKAMASAGITPVVLHAKEGLALINGTHLMAAQGALLATDAAQLLDAARIALAMSIDACRATHAFLDPRLYAARRHVALAAEAFTLRHLLAGSTIVTSHLENDPRVQDPYSLRAGPTILGAASAGIAEFTASIADELGAVTDNPLVFSGRSDYGDQPLPKAVRAKVQGGKVRFSAADMASMLPDAVLSFRGQVPAGPAILSGANFHGMPIAIPLDCLAIHLCHLAGAAERRVYLMTGAFEPESRLKPFLAPQPGLQSGLMIAQYSAAAAVNELVNLATPASVANVPTCAGMEDYNSFGPRAAAKAARGMQLARAVIGIELLVAAQALDIHRPLRSGAAVERAHKAIRRAVPSLKADRPLTPDIEAVDALIRAGQLSLAAVC